MHNHAATVLRLLLGSNPGRVRFYHLHGGRLLSKYSHHVKDKGNDGAYDNERIHQVPDITQIRSGMRDNAQIDDLYK